MARNQRQFRNYLINRKLQIRMTIKFVFFTLLASLLSGLSVYYTLWPTLSRLIPKDIFPILQQNFLFILFWNSIGIIFLIFAAGIIITHRIAGPLYHIEKKLDKALQGGEIVFINLRQGDELQELADKLNILLETIQKNHAKEDKPLSS